MNSRNDRTTKAIANDLRRSRRSRVIGEEEVCSLCGESNLDVLNGRRVQRSILADHHVLLYGNSESVVVVLCLNCHAKIHGGLLEAGIDPKDKEDRTVPSVVATMLHALGLFMRLLAECLILCALRLREHVEALDTNRGNWRLRPGAAW